MHNNIYDVLSVIERLTIVTCNLSSKRDTLPAACDDIMKDITMSLLSTISERLNVLRESLNEK